MGEVRDSRSRGHLLHSTEKDAELAAQSLQSAGDQLIKELVQRQTNKKTSLEEQLTLKQNFVSQADKLDEPSGGKKPLSIEDLMKKTGMSRCELENILSVKPNSSVAKLYRFALSNLAGPSSKTDLISQIPDHPLNHLKTLEEDLMSKLDKQSKVEAGKRRKKKHRTRKKKKLTEQTCQSFEKSQVETLSPSSADTSPCTSICSVDRNVPIRGRSLWDLKDPAAATTETTPRLIGCQPPKLYTVRDGRIIQVSDTINVATNLDTLK